MKTIALKKEKRIVEITLSRPEKRNAINAEMVRELMEVLDETEREEEIRVLLLKGAGSVFSAGADLAYLKELQENTFEENLADSKNLKDLFFRIYAYPKPIIAQVEGAAIAGGCGLAAVCDFCYAVPEAIFGYSEVKIGFIPALVSVFTSRKIGEGKARALLLTGKSISAEQAAEIGLINAVYHRESISEEVYTLAERLAHKVSPQSIALTKELLAETSGMPLSEALETAALYNAKARETADCKKGIRHFLAKKKLEW